METLKTSIIKNRLVNYYNIYLSNYDSKEYDNYTYELYRTITQKKKFDDEDIKNLLVNHYDKLSKTYINNYPTYLLIDVNNNKGIFSTKNLTIDLDIDNLSDIEWNFIKHIYRVLFDKSKYTHSQIYDQVINNNNKRRSVLDIIFDSDYNNFSDLYYINIFYFYRSFPIFNYLLYINKSKILEDYNTNKPNKYDIYDTFDEKKANNVLFFNLYNENTKIYLKNVENLLNTNTNIFDYMILYTMDLYKDEIIKSAFEELLNIYKSINNFTIDRRLNNTILKFLINYMIYNLIDENYSIESDITNLDKNKIINMINKILKEDNKDIYQYLLTTAFVKFYLDLYIYYNNRLIINPQLFKIEFLNHNEQSIADIINVYKSVFANNNKSMGYIFANFTNTEQREQPSFQITIFLMAEEFIKKFLNTMIFVEKIKYSQQSKLLIFFSFSNKDIRFIINENSPSNNLLEELLQLHTFNKTAIIYPQKKY
jgi:hypothetical protein